MKRRTFIVAGAAIAGIGPAAAAPLITGGARLNLRIENATPDRAEVARRWVEKSAAAVGAYYGRFPVPEADVTITFSNTRRIGGKTYPGPVPHVAIEAGGAVSEATLLNDDWVMVHEMVHLAFPWMNLRHNWMSEGLAVYVESVARVQAGHIPQDQIWADFVKAMPSGLPAAGDEGLDRTTTWGRTYWGGALFCLLADVTIRRETANRHGLRTALRAINGARDFRSEHPLRETLELGDAATGRTVLIDQYDAMRETPVMVDLPALWQKLGVEAGDGAVRLDGTAPEAALREAITTA